MATIRMSDTHLGAIMSSYLEARHVPNHRKVCAEITMDGSRQLMVSVAMARKLGQWLLNAANDHDEKHGHGRER